MYIKTMPTGIQATPHEQIEPGSPVRVNYKTGYVFRSEIKPAHPCGSIVVHEIRLTKHIRRVSPGKYKVSNINETVFPNYSGVYKL